jgi:AraC family transcriptional regulator
VSHLPGASPSAFAVELVPRLGPTVADYPPGSAFGPRRARSYEFVWLLSGSATWVRDGGEAVPLTPGTLLLVRPGMRDAFRWDPHRPTRHAYVHFRLTGRESREHDAGWPTVRDLRGRHDPMGALCRYLLWLGTACPSGWRAQAEETLRLLLLTFVNGPGAADGHGPDALPRPVLAMMATVRERWSDGIARPLPLPGLAADAGVSVSTLCRTFRRQFGMSPVAALERLRLARAEPLLWLSNLPLSAIAVQCGFADAYHFSRRFRATYGVAPSAFRATAPEAAPPSPVETGGLAALEALAPPAGAPSPG